MFLLFLLILPQKLKHYLGMKRNTGKDLIGEMMVSALLLLGGAVVTGCTDNNYDLDDIDLTVGVGGGELSIPTSSTTTIKLSEVLDLEENGDVKEDVDGTYRFFKKGETVPPTTTSISSVTVKKASAESFDFVLDLSQYAAPSPKRAASRAAVNFSDEMNVGSFVYNGSVPAEVVELKRADVYSEMSLNISFDKNISKLVSKVTELSLTLPSFMDFEVSESTSEYSKNGNKLVFTNVSTSESQKIVIAIKGLTFGGAEDETGKLTVAGGKVDMEGKVNMGIKIAEDINITSGVDPSKCTIKSGISFMNDIQLTNVTGRFSPSIQLDNLGHTSISGLPDFLNEEGVKVDIENPQIALTLTTDMTVGGLIAGVIKYKRDGVEGSIKLNENIIVNPAGAGSSSSTRVCICRKKSELTNPEDYDQVIEQDDLKQVLYPTVASEISFTATAWADASRTASLELGKTYTVAPEYEIMAPLAFGEDANIVYSDNLDGWNDDIDDFDLKEGGYIELTANVENRVPVYLNVDAKPIGLNGEDLSNEVTVEVTGEVAASANGVDAVVSPVKVKLTPKNGALKKLDGLKLVVTGSAKSNAGGSTVTGIPLNAKTHTLVAKDINVKLVGTLVTDLN